MNEQQNLLLAIVVSVAILFGFQLAFGPETMPPGEESASIETVTPRVPTRERAQTPLSDRVDPSVSSDIGVERAVVPEQTPRVLINPDAEGAAISGSIALKGGRIDDVVLNKYREDTESDSPRIIMFSPSETSHPYHAEFGWVVDQGVEVNLPDSETVWVADHNKLTPAQPVKLSWQNEEGCRACGRLRGQAPRPAHSARPRSRTGPTFPSPARRIWLPAGCCRARYRSN